MKKKQVEGLIGVVAILLTIVLVIVFGWKSSDTKENKATGSFFGMFEEPGDDMVLPEEDFVGIINVVGEIGPSAGGGLLVTTTEYDHDLNMGLVEDMMASDNNKGILLYIDSPGGTVYESDELYLKLMQYKNETGRPIWAYFASEACSGGYYISMAADKIYANRNCTTGSIGVIISALNPKGLYEKIGIEEVNIVSGNNKAMEFTQEQLDVYQGIVDEAYDQFVEIVCAGRKLDDETVRKLADGRVYTAKQALDNQLIDKIGLYEDFVSDLEKEWGLNEDITYYDPQEEMEDPFSALFGVVSTLIPRSDAEIGLEIFNSKKSGIPMYRAH